MTLEHNCYELNHYERLALIKCLELRICDLDLLIGSGGTNRAAIEETRVEVETLRNIYEALLDGL